MSQETDFTYVGSELDLFRDAKCWRTYWTSRIKPFLGPKVLEVGAGNGTVTRTLLSRDIGHWVALEPDSALSGQIIAWKASGAATENLEVVTGTLDECAEDVSSRYGSFDTIMYIDVIEHIEDDRAELERAARLLAPGGFLIVLVPAHMFLFSPFDESLGHFRRYNRKTLDAAAPPDLRIVMRKYLDSAGMMLSLANRMLLRRSMPTPSQIRFWDRFVVRVSTVIDRLFAYRVGKSLVTVWTPEGLPADGDGPKSDDRPSPVPT